METKMKWKRNIKHENVKKEWKVKGTKKPSPTGKNIEKPKQKNCRRKPKKKPQETPKEAAANE